MAAPDSIAGSLLVASTLIVEPTFARSVILVLEHSVAGAFGLVLNQVSDEKVADHLPEWAAAVAPPGVVHIGGPVEPEVGIGLGPDSTTENSPLPGMAILDLTSEPSVQQHGVRIYAGYAGWGPGQLEDELEEGSWYLVPAAPDDPFANPAGLWVSVLRRQPGKLAMVANFPADPSLN